MFSCEFCKIFNNAFFTEHLRATISDIMHLIFLFYFIFLKFQIKAVKFQVVKFIYI